ncbi:MAG: hypothetical protein ABJO67_12435 [Pseudoruegeria sp.]
MQRLLTSLSVFLMIAGIGVSASANDRYAVLAINEVCLDPALSQNARGQALETKSWVKLHQSDLKTYISAAKTIEKMTPVKDDATSSEATSLDYREDLVALTEPQWSVVQVYQASNGAVVVLANTLDGPELCIFLGPDPRSLIFKTWGLQGSGTRKDGVFRFRGDLFRNGSIIEVSELDKRILKFVPEPLRFRFMAVVLINREQQALLTNSRAIPLSTKYGPNSHEVQS